MEKNNKQADYSALLLQIMAHDLLSPLTAIKWQSELLEKKIKERKKRDEYIDGIKKSVELGIALTKHAHIAAKVLTGTYTGGNVDLKLSFVIEKIATDLKLQYERHGLILKSDINDSDNESSLDEALVSLFVWSVAKFFLSCTPAGTVVNVAGNSGDVENNKYILEVSAENIPNAKKYAEIISSENALNTEEYDQAFVFAELIRKIAPKINANIKPHFTEEGLLSIKTSF